LTRDAFLNLSSSEVTEIIKKEGRPKVGVYLPDGSRRAAIILQEAIPKTNDYYNKILGVHLNKFYEDIKIMFEDGLNTLIIPCLKHSNFERDSISIKIIMNSIQTFFRNEKWLDFYDNLDVKVNVYGDFSYIESKGYGQIYDWANEIQKSTKNNKTHKLFWGITASNRYEIPRIMDLAVNYYIEHNKKPSDIELIKLYYGDIIDDVDFLIRAAEIRDSDMQPPIISGVKTQMYFLVAPAYISFTRENYRKIIYDLIFYRSELLGKKNYDLNDIENIDIKSVSQYYKSNNDSIIGLGGKIGKFWLPNTKITIPDGLKEKFDDE
jgi:undecaprenyl pyrophosphate synthase